MTDPGHRVDIVTMSLPGQVDPQHVARCSCGWSLRASGDNRTADRRLFQAVDRHVSSVGVS